MPKGTSKVQKPDMTSNEGEVVMGGAGRDDVGGRRGKRGLTKRTPLWVSTPEVERCCKSFGFLVAKPIRCARCKLLADTSC